MKKTKGGSHKFSLRPSPYQSNLEEYRGRSKKIYTRRSWKNVFVTSNASLMRHAGLTNALLREELHYTKLLNRKFPTIILNASELSEINRPRLRPHYNNNARNIFTYKKNKMIHVHNRNQGIFVFMINAILNLLRINEIEPNANANTEANANANAEANANIEANIEANANAKENAAANENAEQNDSFTYLDMKPENIGKNRLKQFILFDNAPDNCYRIPKKFVRYFQIASIIIAIKNLRRPLTNKELKFLRKCGITRGLIIATFHKRLSDVETNEIKEYVRLFYVENGMPETSEIIYERLLLPRFALYSIFNMLDERYEIDVERRRLIIIQFLEFSRLIEL
jgi:hypothetical protein